MNAVLLPLGPMLTRLPLSCSRDVMPLSFSTTICSHEPEPGPMPRMLVAGFFSVLKGFCWRWMKSTKTPFDIASSTRPWAIMRVFATKPALSWLVILRSLLFLFTTSAIAPA